LPSTLLMLGQGLRLGRFQGAVQPPQDRKWEDDLAVIRLFEVAA